jgi:hypothetical protein
MAGSEAAMQKLVKPGEFEALGYTDRDELITIQGRVAANTKSPNPMEIMTFPTLIAQSASYQAKYFMDVYFLELGEARAREIYDMWKKFKVVQKDAANQNKGVHEDSPSIPIVVAQGFLGQVGKPMTTAEFKTAFAEIDSNFDGQMAFAEFLAFHFQKTPADIIYRPNKADPDGSLKKAIRKLLNAQKAIRDHEDKLSSLQAKIDDPATSNVKKNGLINEKKQYENGSNLQSLEHDVASSMASLHKKYKAAKNAGSDFWDATVAAELESQKSQKSQGRS